MAKITAIWVNERLKNHWKMAPELKKIARNTSGYSMLWAHPDSKSGHPDYKPMLG